MNDIAISKKSLLWKVSRNGLRPSYLLGTMHLVCEEDFHIKPKVIAALKKCDYYFMEVDLAQHHNNFHEEEASEISLSEGLNPEEKEELEKILQEDYGLGLEQVEHQSPVFLINRMITEAIGCTSMKMAEMELLAIAMTEGMMTGGLETTEEQMAIADKVFHPGELLRQLRSGKEYKSVFEKMVQAYQDENLKVLADLVNDPRFMSREAFDVLVTQRNANWANAIPEIMKQGTTFFAIGAGHLPGKHGVIYLLKAKGFAVNPVYR